MARNCSTKATAALSIWRGGRCSRERLIRHLLQMSRRAMASGNSGGLVLPRYLEREQRRVLLPAIDVAVVLGARALRARKAHLDRQRRVVVDDDDVGRVAVVEAGDRGAVDDFGVAGAAIGLGVI